MNPTRLRNILQTLYILRWLRRNPQHSVPVALLTLYLGVWRIVPSYKAPILLASPPVLSVAPTLTAPATPAYPPEKSLFQHAVKILDLDCYWDWGGGYEGYGWLSNHEFLYQDYAEGGTTRVQHCRLFRYNTQTRKCRLLKRLTRRVDCFYHSQMEISPDGKWMLWHGRTDRPETIDAATIDGRRHLQWPCGYYTRDILNWTADSRHWIDFRLADTDTKYQFKALIHDVNAPRKETALPIVSGSLSDNYGARIQKNIVTISAPEFEKVTAELRVTEAQIGSRIAPLRQYAIRLPASIARLPNAGIINRLLSPSADQIALLLCYDVPAQSDKAAQRVLGLWVCRKDGSEMRNLGDWRRDSNPNRFPDLEGLRWLPDGRRLSFVCREALWTVRTD